MSFGPIWLAGFRINGRKVGSYRWGRAFLAGDATHVDPGPLKEADPVLCQRVKTFPLGCGYQMGAKRFRDDIEDKLGIKYTEEQAKELIRTYRTENPSVAMFWNALNSDIQDAFLNHADRALNVNLPSGRSVRYSNIRANPNSKRTWGLDLIADVGGVKQVRLYGGSLTENMIQATGRDVFAEAVLRLEDAAYTQKQLRLGCVPLRRSLSPEPALHSYYVHNGSTKTLLPINTGIARASEKLLRQVVRSANGGSLPILE